MEGDSQLVINFGTREYAPRNIALYTAMDQVRSEARDARRKLVFLHIPREENGLADGLGRLAVARGGDVTLSDILDLQNPPSATPYVAFAHLESLQFESLASRHGGPDRMVELLAAAQAALLRKLPLVYVSCPCG